MKMVSVNQLLHSNAASKKKLSLILKCYGQNSSMLAINFSELIVKFKRLSE